jgi:hypothetical protein
MMLRKLNDAASSYEDFLERKRQIGGNHGFEPLWMPDFLFDFQQHLVNWALHKGRAALFEDCGLGKTIGVDMSESRDSLVGRTFCAWIGDRAVPMRVERVSGGIAFCKSLDLVWEAPVREERIREYLDKEMRAGQGA